MDSPQRVRASEDACEMSRRETVLGSSLVRQVFAVVTFLLPQPSLQVAL